MDTKGLASALAKSPQLVDLHLGSNIFSYRGEGPSLHEVFRDMNTDLPSRLTHLSLLGWCVRLDSLTLPHLRNLVSLTLRNNLHPSTRNRPPPYGARNEVTEHSIKYCSTTDEIWTALLQEKIHLEEIHIAHMCSAFLKYLTNYSGLKTLTLKSFDSKDRDTPDMFYQTSLVRHSETLQCLEVRPAFEGPWCFGKHNCTVLSRFKKLSSLSMCCDVTEMKRIGEDMVVSEKSSFQKCQNIIFSNLIQASFLHTMAQLPRMCTGHASLQTADSTSNRGARCGNPSMHYRARADKLLDERIVNFGPVSSLESYPQQIDIAGRSFKLTPCDDLVSSRTSKYHPLGSRRHLGFD